MVADGIEGFCNVDVKEDGPVHRKVAPAAAVDVRLSVPPTQRGLLLPAVTVPGPFGTMVMNTVSGVIQTPVPTAITVNGVVPKVNEVVVPV